MEIEAYKRRLSDCGDPMLEDKINRTARRMKQACQKGDAARALSLRERVATLSLKCFSVHGGNASDGVDDVLLDVIMNLLDKFDPEKSDFTHAVRFYYKKRVQDLGKSQANAAKRQQDLVYEDSDGKEQMHDCADGRAEGAFAASEAEPGDENEAAAATLLELLSLVTAFVSKTSDARFAVRRQFTPLFFTETVVRMTKDQPNESDCKPLCRHEKSLFKAMEVPFLDTFMLELCRCVVDIWRSGFKDGVKYLNRIQDAQDGSAAYSAWALPAVFFKSYCAENWGSAVEDATISQQRKHYEGLVLQLKKK